MDERIDALEAKRAALVQMAVSTLVSADAGKAFVEQMETMNGG